MKKLVRLFVAVAVSSSMLACSSTTQIRSTDHDAKIYVDGEFRGKGSVTYTDTKTIGSTTSVRLEKTGCEPKMYMFSRNEEFDAGACAGGVFVLVPFLWIQKYKPEHVYEFECEPKGK
ncbi:MAG TPA: hypothetical protein VN132_02260 [Bdellovibrio sp.]|nr:hypothetical protein [Bdellovibrio sp.]